MALKIVAALAVLAFLAVPFARAEGEQSEAQQIVELLSVRPGQAVAVTGPAAMTLAPLLSDRVGADGYVFVADTDAAILQNVRHQIEEQQLTNTIAIAATGNDLSLPHTVDLVILYNSYHHISKRSSFFANLSKYLRANASIAVIDYYRRPMNVGPPWKERVSSSRVMREMSSHGYALKARYRISPIKYFLVYSKKK